MSRIPPVAITKCRVVDPTGEHNVGIEEGEDGKVTLAIPHTMSLANLGRARTRMMEVDPSLQAYSPLAACSTRFSHIAPLSEGKPFEWESGSPVSHT